ncbi:transposase [Psychrobacter sp. DM4]
MPTKRREYTREFKLEAVSLMSDHKFKIVEVAKSLRMGTSTFYYL